MLVSIFEPLLKIGITFATFRHSGWTPVLNDVFANLAIGDAITSHIRFRIFGGRLQGPVPLFMLKLLIIFCISLVSVLVRNREFGCGGGM